MSGWRESAVPREPAGAGAAGGAGEVAGGCVAQAASSVSKAAPAETRRRDVRFI